MSRRPISDSGIVTRPNAGVQAHYDLALRTLLDEMESSVRYWVQAAYEVPDGLAQDVSSAVLLRETMARLKRTWLKRFADLAPKLAGRAVRDAAGHVDRTLLADLRRGGFTVRFKTTPAVQNVITANVASNVALIKSIPEQYLKDVEGAVMRSVSSGRDLKSLTDTLDEIGAVSRRRAARIALNQNNQATAQIVRARRLELGLTTAVWQHSAAGRHPRPTHVAMNGKDFDVAKGMWDPEVQKWIQPGELINCRCTSRVKLPTFKPT